MTDRDVVGVLAGVVGTLLIVEARRLATGAPAGCARLVADLYGELGTTRTRLDEATRRLVAEQALTRELRGVIALLPYTVGAVEHLDGGAP